MNCPDLNLFWSSRKQKCIVFDFVFFFDIYHIMCNRQKNWGLKNIQVSSEIEAQCHRNGEPVSL